MLPFNGLPGLMLVSLDSLQAAIAAHLGADTANLVRVRVYPDAEGLVCLKVAAGELVGVLFGPDVAAAPIRSGQLTGDDRSVALAPDVMRAHPLLSGWVADTPADYAAAAMLSGATLAHLAVETPVFEALEVVRAGDAWEAVASLHYPSAALPPATAVLFYGEPLAALGLTNSTRLSGDTLFEIGADAQSGKHVEPSPVWARLARAVVWPGPAPHLTVH